MAHHQSAVKRIRLAEKSRLINRTYKSKISRIIKAVRSAANKEDAQKALDRAIPFLDKMANKNRIHANKAANQKSRLTRFVNKMS